VWHGDRKSGVSSTVNEPKGRSKPQGVALDMVYVLDLSGLDKQDEEITSWHRESATMLDLSQDTRDKFGNMTALKQERAERTEAAEEGDDGRPADETRRLTRMLVAAKSPDEVQSVLAETYNHMREWQALAASGDKKALSVVRKLNRLVSRGNRKIRDLNKEQVMLIRQQKAEKAEQKQIAERLRFELEQAERVRKQRERRYLQEQDGNDDDDDEPDEMGPSMAATEAKIRALAAAMAAISTNTSGAANAGYDGSGDGITLADVSVEGGELSGGESSEDI